MRDHQKQECDLSSWSFLTAAFGYLHGTQMAIIAASLTEEDVMAFKREHEMVNASGNDQRVNTAQ